MINSTLVLLVPGWLRIGGEAKCHELSGLQIGEAVAKFGYCFAYRESDAPQGKSNEGETKWPRKP
jgi:hypothetical protein